MTHARTQIHTPDSILGLKVRMTYAQMEANALILNRQRYLPDWQIVLHIKQYLQHSHIKKKRHAFQLAVF